MLQMCALCQNKDKVKAVDAGSPEKNQCFEARRYTENYRPFKSDKQQVVRLTCRHFSHIKTAVINYKGGGRRVIRATPEAPNVDLSDLPLFAPQLPGMDDFFGPNPDCTGKDPYIAFGEWAAANGYDLDDDSQLRAAIEAYGDDSAEMPPLRVAEGAR